MIILIFLLVHAWEQADSNLVNKVWSHACICASPVIAPSLSLPPGLGEPATVVWGCAP
jgi:hypothetical protein